MKETDLNRAGPPSSERPDVGRYSDYRVYLRDMIVHLRVAEPGFSYRNFARRAGFGSPNYLKLVADGERNLAAESVDMFGRGLSLSKREVEVFRILVALANARSDEQRNELYVRLRERVVADETTQLRDDQLAVYDVWWALVVRDMAQLPDFQMDARWIAHRLRPRIKVAQAQRAIEILLRLKLIGEIDGRVRVMDSTISTGPEVHSLAVRNHHRALLELAGRSLDEVPREERNVTSVTLVMSEAGYREAVEEIAALRRRLLQISDRCVRDGVDASREVYSGVFTMVPVTQPVRERRGAVSLGALSSDEPEAG